ncbi:MAG: peptidase M3, partial [Candidatus Aminicenantes bacterium]|nr:peptidase M3 [Candidatus Aminicenantes bacterium]
MNKLIWIAFCTTALLFLFATMPGCSPSEEKPQEAGNPFFADYGTPFETPAFDRIQVEHYVPAIEEGIRRHQAEVDAIIQNTNAPTFVNTMQALDRTGEFLERVAGVFYSLMSADTTPELQAAAKEIAPRLSAHSDNISLNEKLFARVKALYEQKDELGLDAEQAYMLEHTYKD